jgi:dTDP-4-amino-4,6-dideoxygalactose transaminase
MQQGKHMTTGEGGMVVTNDEGVARRMFLFINKAWGYGDPQPDHYFLALNYRISELHAGVALAQLDKLPSVVERRIAAAEILTRMLAGIPGIQVPSVRENDIHVYWKYCLNVDRNTIRDGALGLAKALKEYGIASAPRYIQKPAFMCEIFQKRRTFGTSEWPFSLARPEAVDYSKSKFPMTFKALDEVLVLPWNERYTQEHLEFIGNAIQESVRDLSL